MLTLALLLAVGMPVICPGICQSLLSLGHQSRSTEVRSQDCSNHGSGPVVGLTEADVTLAWPNPHVYGPTTYTVAKSRSTLTAGVLIRSYVL